MLLHDTDLRLGDLLGGGEPRHSEFTGLKALMVAVFEDGIRSYCGPPGADRTQAEVWVVEQSALPIFVCRHLRNPRTRTKCRSQGVAVFAG